eukprot:CAMPEP_0195509070 /NCGR_PEP_ID=MMETSP0794_2-20130614/2102_1 /TAXON_ID=515487 /ORGANISM="Stephanopyxis turris, Strain CCMP 815" /LENGTH=335 /DNA_ID=CAMNT_0040636191 /DNA_START=94 /DNA_END=1101 /DNA_ORIENTATION=+
MSSAEEVEATTNSLFETLYFYTCPINYDAHTVFIGIVTLVLCVAIVKALSGSSTKKVECALDKDEFKPFTLSKKEIISHDTRRFTFSLQTPTTLLGLPVGQHISFRFNDPIEKKNHQRSYTPTTGNETPGTVTFVIKVYKAGVHPKFPNGGKMSQHLDSLKIGDSVDMKGPKGHLTYLGQGNFTVKLIGKPLQTRRANHIGMIAGGTGITPIMQVVTAIFRDEKDTTTTMSVLYANQTEDDILLRSELETLAAKYPKRFSIHYTLDRPPKDWKYSTGFINEEMINKHCLMNGSKKCDGVGHATQIFMCGPPPMIKFACLPNLEKLSFTDEDWFSF